MTVIDAPADLSVLSAILLGILQGITEFLPISSSGHLALANHLGWAEDDPLAGVLAFDLILHLATVMVVIKAFWSSIKGIILRDHKVLLWIVVASIPTGIAGVLARDFIVLSLRQQPVMVCLALLTTGAFLLYSDRVKVPLRPVGELGVRRSLLVGLCQALALIPGISRSGLTITGGVVTGLNRDESVRFSFILMVPAVLGASFFDIIHDPLAWNRLPILPTIAGFLAAFASGYGALALLKILTARKRLSIFAIYCFIVGGAGLIYFSL